ncbi:hypothetical protein IAR50_000257 [Cryptococcus sp. DSM 104548]
MPAEGSARKGRRSSTSFILPAISNISQPAAPAVMNGVTNASKDGKDAKDPYANLLHNYYDAAPYFWPEFKDASQAPLQLKGCLPNGLLPCPQGPGWSIDVNDLLILHPDKAKGQQGYTEWKLITCRACGKTYDGKNGRSVARRHLQDKHGMPLAAQSRRSRWDWLKGMGDEDGQDMHGKKRKRPNTAPRMQAKIERHYSDFLLKFGPVGLATSYGLTLIAPKFRPAPGEAPAPFTVHPQNAGYYKTSPAGREQWIDGSYGKVIVPEEIGRAVGAIWDGIDFEHAGEDAAEDAPAEKAVKKEALEESARGQSESPVGKQPSQTNGKDVQGEPSSQSRRQAQPQSHTSSQKPPPTSKLPAETPPTMPLSRPSAQAEPDTHSTSQSSTPSSNPRLARIPIISIPPLPRKQARGTAQTTPRPAPADSQAPEAIPTGVIPSGAPTAEPSPRPNYSIKVKRLANDGQTIVTGPIPVSSQTSKGHSPAGPSQPIPSDPAANQTPAAVQPTSNLLAPLDPLTMPLNSSSSWPTFGSGPQPVQNMSVVYPFLPQQPMPHQVVANAAIPPNFEQMDEATRMMLLSQMRPSWDSSAGQSLLNGNQTGLQMQTSQQHGP